MRFRVSLVALATAMLLAGTLSAPRLLLPAAQGTPAPAATPRDPSPVDLVLTPDGTRLLTANQGSDSVSLVRLSDGAILAEASCGHRPSAVAISPDGAKVLVSGTYSGELTVLSLAGDKLSAEFTLDLGYEPRGVAVSPDGRTAYVALSAAHEVAVIDLEKHAVAERITVGRWPRSLALTSDGKILAVGASGEGGISVVDTATRQKLYDTKFQGLNIGQIHVSADNAYAYFPWMVYADRPITAGNIREGWVLGNRVARVRLDGPARREALALDPRGRAVGDPQGLALSADEKCLAIAAAGTHELVVFRLDDLPLRSDGPGDHLSKEIANDAERMIRVPLGGRPMAIRFDREGHVLVANALANAVQVVNLAEQRVERTIALGGPAEPSLARRGEAIFFDANRSADGWYSCQSCHFEGDGNAVTMDTKNDGSFGTYKMVLSLRNAAHTGPWFWHGWQKDLPEAVRKSLGETMQGPAPSDDDVEALTAYLKTLETPATAPRNTQLSSAAQRGRELFASEDAACANCHSGPYFTDGEVHDVGLGSQYDKFKGYNTPSLVGVGARARYLHHGRADTLAEVITDLHSPAKVSGTRELSEQETSDLVEYLRSL